MATLILTLMLSWGAAGAVELQVRVSPVTARIGDPLELELRVAGAGTRRVHFATLPEQKDMALLDVDSSRFGEGVLKYTIALYDTGTRTLPPLFAVLGSGASAETLRADGPAITIQSILPDTAATPQPNKPNREHPFQWRELLPVLWMLSAAGAVVLLWWLWRRWRKARTKPQSAPAVPLLPPADEAVRALIQLRDKRYPERGMLKEFYSEFSDIMRRYLERRFGFPALEMTTFEISHELEDPRFPEFLGPRLLPVLREADLVKFAKHVPDYRECDARLELGFELVEATREPAVTVADKKEEAAA